MPGNKGMTYLKKTCSGCKAWVGYCKLGHPVDWLHLPESLCSIPIPVEPCEKPRTVKKLVGLLEMVRRVQR